MNTIRWPRGHCHCGISHCWSTKSHQLAKEEPPMATFLLHRRKQKILDIYNCILQWLSTLLSLERNLYTCTASYTHQSIMHYWRLIHNIMMQGRMPCCVALSLRKENHNTKYRWEPQWCRLEEPDPLLTKGQFMNPLIYRQLKPKI